jgi:hypothetical protein
MESANLSANSEEHASPQISHLAGLPTGENDKTPDKAFPTKPACLIQLIISLDKPPPTY